MAYFASYFRVGNRHHTRHRHHPLALGHVPAVNVSRDNERGWVFALEMADVGGTIDRPQINPSGLAGGAAVLAERLMIAALSFGSASIVHPPIHTFGTDGGDGAEPGNRKRTLT